jgi:PAS domain-containing protein
MSNNANGSSAADQLRLRATSKLTGGIATHARASSFDALAVLHRLATSPSTADGALALLHELQVHQVELDMQAEELRESRVELESELRWHLDRYDLQPVGCFTLNRDYVVQELNVTGANMLGVERDQGLGQALDSFFVPRGGAALRDLLGSSLGNDLAGTKPTLLELIAGSQGSRAVQARARSVPARELYLVILTDVLN